MRPMRSTDSSCPAPPSCCSASSRSRRSPPRCCTARRSPRSAWSAPIVTPLLVATDAAELLGALHLSRRRHRRRLCARARAAVALARDHRGGASARSGRCRASTTARRRADAASRSMSWPALRSSPRCIVAGLFYGPDAEPGEIDPVSSGALGAYLLRAPPCWCSRRHHDGLALVAFAAPRRRDRRHRLAHRCRGRAVPVAAVLASAGDGATGRSSAEFAHLVAPAGRRRRAPDAAAVACRHRTSLLGSAAVRGAVRRRRLPGAGPLRPSPQSRSCGRRPRSPRRSLILVALYYRIAGFERSIPFAGLALLLAALFAASRPRRSRKREPRPGIAVGRRDLRHRRDRGARARADLRAGTRLAHRRARPDGAGHRLDRRAAAAADAALALRRHRRAGAGAHRLGAAHRRRRRRHDADLQLAALRLRRAGARVLGRRLAAAPARRRRAVAHGRMPPRSCSRC